MQENFFTQNLKKIQTTHAPLAERMRPQNLGNFVGQEHIIGKERLLYRLIQTDRLTSVIFSGPPGTGKTTLAKIIAHQTNAVFYELNAVTAGKKDIVEILEKAKVNVGAYNKKSILFIDEIHRFNKAQQDALLPSVEQGLIVLIGATTENPSYEINSPLISRSTIFQFKALTKENIITILKQAVLDRENGYGVFKVTIDDDAYEHFANMANGDVRRALNAIELGVLTKEKNKEGFIHIDFETAQECIQKKAVYYDKKGDNHYDTISAFIKSIRGSDPDAALYWLAKMLEAGEDPKFIARRLIISASEDIGNAEPMALIVAVSTAKAVEMIGLPEAQINLAQAVTFLAASPKSNAAYKGIKKTRQVVQEQSNAIVPPHLSNTRNKTLEANTQYKYPHDYPQHYVKQSYLPEDLQGQIFYHPTDIGKEKSLKDYLESIRTLEV